MKQQHLKQVAKQRLEKINLRRIVLPPHEFQWTELGEEISIQGELFDIKCYSIKNGKFIFYGLFDKDETTLDRLAHNFKNNEQDNKLLTELFQVLQSLFHNSSQAHESSRELANQYPYLSPDKLCFQPKKIITPPPQA